MPAYPGVYVEEGPQGVPPITGVDTAVAAFVGWFPRGPLNSAVPLLSFTDVEREFGGLHTHSDTSFALAQYFRNGGRGAWAVRVAAPGAGGTALARASASVSAVSTGDAFVVRARSEGVWGNDISVRVIGPGGDGRFDLHVTLHGSQNAVAVVLEEEVFTGLTVMSATDARYLPMAVNGVSRLIEVSPGSGGFATPTGTTALAGGGDGARPGAPEIVGTESSGSGMFALETTDFTLLCLPSIANHAPSTLDGLADASVHETITAQAIAYCRRKRALLLLDPPDTVSSPGDVLRWVDEHEYVRDDFAALYYPRVLVADPTQNDVPRPIGPCGTVAGLMARVDSAGGVWAAPAGRAEALLGLSGLTVDMTDAQAGDLNRLALNCLRRLPGYGTVVWGARTLAGPDPATSEYAYIPTRRLANYLESSLVNGLQWVAFEPNDEALWSRIRLSAEGFLKALFRERALAGRTAREAYLVRCDRSTMTADELAQGIVNVVVGFAPRDPAEFVILRIRLASARA